METFKIVIADGRVDFFTATDFAATAPNVHNVQYKQFFRSAELMLQEDMPDNLKLCFASSVVTLYPEQIAELHFGTEEPVLKSATPAAFETNTLFATLLAQLEPTTI